MPCKGTHASSILAIASQEKKKIGLGSMPNPIPMKGASPPMKTVEDFLAQKWEDSEITYAELLDVGEAFFHYLAMMGQLGVSPATILQYTDVYDDHPPATPGRLIMRDFVAVTCYKMKEVPGSKERIMGLAEHAQKGLAKALSKLAPPPRLRAVP